MAIVTTKKRDSKYAHLEKIYTDQSSKPAVEKADEVSEIKLEKEDVKISRREIAKSLGLVIILGILGISGYLLARFL